MNEALGRWRLIVIDPVCLLSSVVCINVPNHYEHRHTLLTYLKPI